MKADRTLDCIGLFCPMPIVKTKIKLEGMEEGMILEVLADDPGAKSDFPAWCQATGNKLFEVEEENGILKFYIQKGERKNRICFK